MAEIESKDNTAADVSELEDEKWDSQEDKSQQRYDILCMLFSGEAKSVIREVRRGDGIAAWQAFAKRYAPRTLANVLKRYREVMKPVSAKDLSEVVGVISRWETKWKELKGSDRAMPARHKGPHLPDC